MPDGFVAIFLQCHDILRMMGWPCRGQYSGMCSDTAPTLAKIISGIQYRALHHNFFMHCRPVPGMSHCQTQQT